ncbi:9450_t:CDS:2 [Entrophospora sp. SA101]|nr:9450_t:CDS:2 [Entrophospora sp. SA101]
MITKADNKEYLYSLHDLSDVSYTAKILRDEIECVLSRIELDKFAAVVSDNASAILSARKQISEKYPFILNTNSLSRKYIDEYGIKDGELHSYTPTRWTSMFETTNSILQLKQPLEKIYERHKDLLTNDKLKHILGLRGFFHDVGLGNFCIVATTKSNSHLEGTNVNLVDCFIQLVKLAVSPILTNSTVIDENSVLINPDVPAEHSMLINPTVNDTQYFIDPSLLTKSQEEQQLEQSAEQLEQPEQSEQVQKIEEEEPKEIQQLVTQPQEEHKNETSFTTKQVQQAHQGHSYGTRFANQQRPTPGIEVRSRARKQKKGKTEEYCICLRSAYGTMVNCDICNDWCHIECVNLTEQQAVEMDKYICPKCQGNHPYIGLLKDECSLSESFGIDPKALLIVKHKDDGSFKCLNKECPNSAQKKNSYCGGEICYLLSKNLDSKTSKGVELQTQKSVSSSFPVTKESKKVPSQVHSTKFTSSSKSITNKFSHVKPHLVPSSSKLQSTNVNIVQGASAANNNSSGSSGTKTAIAKKSGQNLDQKGDLPKTDDTPAQLGERLARKLEEAIYDAFTTKNDKEPLGQPYKSKFRNLHTSLGHPKNDQLLTNVVKGDIPAVKLVQMTPEELANPEQKSLMVKVRRESMQQSVLKAEDMGPRIKKTHKGEYVIVDDFLDSSKNDSSSLSSQQDKISSTSKSTNSIGVSPTRPKINLEDLIPKRKTSVGMLDSPPYSPGALSPSVSSSFGSPSKTPPGEPTNNAIIEPITVWKGKLFYDGVARFSGKASLVAAKKLDKVRNWDEYLTASIRVNGHVSRVEQADTYLIDCWCSPSKDVIFIKFEVDDAYEPQFDIIFNYLRYSPKDQCVRYGRVANAYNAVRELYLIPLEPEDKIPDVVTFLEYDEVLIPKTDDKKRDSKLLLGALVIVEAESGKLKRPMNHSVSKSGNSSRPDKKEKSHHESVKSISESNKQNEKSEIDSIIKPQQNVVPTPINPAPQSLQPPNSQQPQPSYTNNMPIMSAPNGQFTGFFQSLLANSNMQNIAPQNLPAQNLSATTGHYNAQPSPFNNPLPPPPIPFNQSQISIPSSQPQVQQYTNPYSPQYQTAMPLQNNQHPFIPTHHSSPGLQTIPSQTPHQQPPPAYPSYDQYYSQTAPQPMQTFVPHSSQQQQVVQNQISTHHQDHHQEHHQKEHHHQEQQQKQHHYQEQQQKQHHNHNKEHRHEHRQEYYQEYQSRQSSSSSSSSRQRYQSRYDNYDRKRSSKRHKY